MAKRDLWAIAAMAQRWVIGKEGTLPWQKGEMPSDMRRFKEMTLGHTVLMGWKTFDSIRKRNKNSPLWGRENIVLTRHHALEVSRLGALPIASIEEALEIPADKVVYVIGGGEVYKLALPHLTEIFLTKVEADLPGDAYFPRIDSAKWEVISRKGPKKWDPKDKYRSEIVVYQRR